MDKLRTNKPNSVHKFSFPISVDLLIRVQKTVFSLIYLFKHYAFRLKMLNVFRLKMKTYTIASCYQKEEVDLVYSFVIFDGSGGFIY